MCNAYDVMVMLLYFGEARQRTVAEYSELFRAMGLDYSRVVSTSSASASSNRDSFNGATVRTEPLSARCAGLSSRLLLIAARRCSRARRMRGKHCGAGGTDPVWPRLHPGVPYWSPQRPLSDTRSVRN
jgi:hypothetical protein